MIKKLSIFLLTAIMVISFSGVILGEESPPPEESIISVEDDGSYVDRELPRNEDEISEEGRENQKDNRIKVAGL